MKRENILTRYEHLIEVAEATMVCDWCGHGHDRSTLCTKRPRWTRRGFLQMAAATLGVAFPGNLFADSQLHLEPRGALWMDRGQGWEDLGTMARVDKQTLIHLRTQQCVGPLDASSYPVGTPRRPLFIWDPGC